jgi:hypothetical protein
LHGHENREGGLKAANQVTQTKNWMLHLVLLDKTKVYISKENKPKYILILKSVTKNWMFL